MRAHSLAERDAELRELMDEPDCDLAMLRRTYAQFRVVNHLVSGWAGIYRRLVRPLLASDRPTTLLDIGCGAADVSRALARRAARDSRRLEITAIDPDRRAYDYAIAQRGGADVTYRCASSTELVAEGARFDVVISNHVLHHLDDRARSGLLNDSALLAARRVIHNDLARSRAAYLGYAVLSRPFRRHSFIHVDGLRSLRRSFRVDELRAAVPPPWEVVPRTPSRLLLMLDLGQSSTASHGRGPS